MSRIATSITIEEWIKEELSKSDINISDLSNTLLTAWIRSLKQKGNVIDRTVLKTKIITELKSQLREIEDLILFAGEEKV